MLVLSVHCLLLLQLYVRVFFVFGPTLAIKFVVLFLAFCNLFAEERLWVALLYLYSKSV